MLALTGALAQIVNILKETLNRLIGLLDILFYFAGFRPVKKLRLRVVILRDENGQPLVDPAKVEASVVEANRVFELVAQTRIVAAEPLVVTAAAIAPTAALNVHCDDGAWQEDFGQTGAYFRKASAGNISGTILGYAAPVTVMIVKEISGKGGCSLGPLADYVTEEARYVAGNRLMAHEVAHACGLWHSEDTANLMYPKRPGEQLSPWQAAIFRNSRHVTYL